VVQGMFEGAGYELFLKGNGHEQSLGFIKVFITGHDKTEYTTLLVFCIFFRQPQQVCMRSVAIRRLQGSVCLGHSLRSFSRLTPPTFGRHETLRVSF
jgi:hypothetical protein